MDKYKEILIEERHLYGGSHTLKMWVHGLKSGFIVSDCVRKKKYEFDKTINNIYSTYDFILCCI